MVPFIIAGVILFFIVVACFLFIYFKSKRHAEIQPDNIQALADFVRADKEKREEESRIKQLKKEEQKSKLETFKKTKDELKEKLKSQIDAKYWRSLNSVLSSADKGGVGIYIIHNQTKNKFYVGQAKQIFSRIKKHFDVSDLARDFLTGDAMQIKFLTANELDDSYRLDHIEKTGIEIFNADTSGYNKTTGNI